MPGVIDPETMNLDDLPGIWSPVQWEQTPEERVTEIENQAQASLLTTVDVPEAILRLLLGETLIENLYAPPRGYDTTRQGEWDDSMVTFAFNRRFELSQVHRTPERLEVVYKVEDLGYWQLVIEPYRVTIERI